MSNNLYFKHQKYSREFNCYPDSLTFKLGVHNNDWRRSNKFTDIIIKVGKSQFPAHRLVLASSDLGRISFHNPFQTVFELDEKHVHSGILEDLLTFLYTQKIIMKMDTVHQIMIASKHLKIESLLSLCEQFFIETADLKNIFGWFSFSLTHELDNVKNHCLDYMMNNREDVFQKCSTLNLSVKNFPILLCNLNKRHNDGLGTLSNMLYDFVIKWTEEDIKNRAPFFSELIRCIPFSDKLLRKLFSSYILSTSHSCSKFLINILRKLFNLLEEYHFGGFSLDNDILASCTKFSYIQNTDEKYTDELPMPMSWVAQSGVVIEQKVYLFGGENETEISSRAYMLDCSSNTWLELAPIPYEKRFGEAVAACNGFIYITGGISDKTTTYSETLRYSVKTDEWTTVKSMNYSRLYHESVELNGRLYVIGGYKLLKNGVLPFIRTFLQDVMDIRHLGSSKYITFPGGNCKIIPRNTVEEYNPLTDEWKPVASCFYHHDNYFSAVAHRGKIYVTSALGFEIFYPESNSWKTLNSFKSEFLDTSLHPYGLMASTGEKLLIFSSKSSQENRIYSYDKEKEKFKFYYKKEKHQEHRNRSCDLVVSW